MSDTGYRILDIRNRILKVESRITIIYQDQVSGIKYPASNNKHKVTSKKNERIV